MSSHFVPGLPYVLVNQHDQKVVALASWNLPQGGERVVLGHSPQHSQGTPTRTVWKGLPEGFAEEITKNPRLCL